MHRVEAVYSFRGFELRGVAPLFDGETTATQSATFHLRAVQAGETLVSLATTYGTEDQCVNEDTGSVYFQEGATITAGSQQYLVRVGVAAEPTATASPSPTNSPAPTSTATPTATSAGSGGTGCHIDGSGETPILPIALCAASLLLLHPRRGPLRQKS